ncbi:MAG: SAM-dependent methyltransferase, partial [Chloroflexi bacterium]|nr:SAM-dependent methyltransferase [Chloroflexota bacterium]
VTPDAKSVLVPNRNYVVMRRFSAKEEQRRIVAAPYFRAAFAANYIGLENHLNFIRRLNGELSDEEICGLAALLNSSMVDEAFREISGNTQVSATELRKMPLPSLEAIVEIGRSCLAPNSSLARIDELVLDVLGRQAL